MKSILKIFIATTIMLFVSSTGIVAQQQVMAKSAISPKFTLKDGAKVYMLSETQAKIATKDGHTIIINAPKIVLAQGKSWFSTVKDAVIKVVGGLLGAGKPDSGCSGTTTVNVTGDGNTVNINNCSPQ
jgi:hypothetical protein